MVKQARFDLQDKVYIYNYAERHLENTDGENNDIFYHLRLSDNQLYRWASRCYGINTEEGSWPFVPQIAGNPGLRLDAFVKELKYACEWCDDHGQFPSNEGWEEMIRTGKFPIHPYDPDYEEEEEEVYPTIKRKNPTKDIYPDGTPMSIYSPQHSTNLKQTTKDGKIITAFEPSPQIVRGEKRRGHTIQGRQCPITIAIGHLSNKEIFG